MITFLASRKREAGSCGAAFSSLTGAVAAACGAAVALVDLVAMEVFPKRISARLRFIALHIICVSNRPEAPTIPPITTKSGSPIAIPAIAPATPLKEFNKEMVIGISAPPTRIEKATPKKALKRTTSQISQPVAGTRAIATMPTAKMTKVNLMMI